MRTPEVEDALKRVSEAVAAAREVASLDACVWTATQAAYDRDPIAWPSKAARALANAAVRGIADAAADPEPKRNLRVATLRD